MLKKIYQAIANFDNTESITRIKIYGCSSDMPNHIAPIDDKQFYSKRADIYVDNRDDLEKLFSVLRDILPTPNCKVSRTAPEIKRGVPLEITVQWGIKCV